MKGYLLLMVFVLGSLLPAAAQGQNRTITGRVTGENKSALSGVSVQVKGNTSIGVSTGADGRYSLSVPANATALTFSFLGYETREINLRPGSTTYNAMMSQSVITMGPAVVQAGIMTREAATYTGDVKQLSQAQLKETGTLSAVTALSLLDPSFLLVDNNLAGSDPNALPTIELNGKTTMNVQGLQDETTVNPNEPHFVIDGFDSDLETFRNLDINRIASITLLKDAGSTAIYGSKGANGVVVIETVKPKAGELMVNYNFNGTVSFADLSGYNLMNAKEKLQFEILSRYYNTGSEDIESPLNGSSYWHRYAQVARGIDTYWLKYPVRTGFSQKHDLQISGGDGTLNYQGALGYSKTQGVMKGSGNDNVRGNVFLQYRKDNLNVANDLIINGGQTHTGSYGSFQDWANMSPYFKPWDDNGKLIPNVNPESGLVGSGDYTANPLYNASLYTDNATKSFGFTNNTRAEYFMSDLGLRFSGALSVSRSSSQTDNYKDPRHTDFRDKVPAQSGTYTYSDGNTWKWSGNLAATWIKTLADRHNFTVMGRTQADHTKTWGASTSAEGFAEGVRPRLSMAYSYPESSRPGSSETVKRNVNFLGTLSYNYDRKYLFDGTFSADGGTAFGREKLFTTNWSLGTGWVVTNEKFAESWSQWINNLKLRGSIGTNVNQAGSALAQNTYGYAVGNDYFGQAWQLDGIANPYLDWQKTLKITIGVDATLLDNRLNLNVSYINNKTNPQTIGLPQPPSVGIDSYDVNMGLVHSSGVNGSVSYQILRNIEKRLLFSVRLSAAHTKERYDGFGAAFARLNEQLANALTNIDTSPNSGGSVADQIERQEAMQQVAEMLNNNVALRRYVDGADPNGLWTVPSLGIDPATGREIFLDPFGNPTFTYDIRASKQIASSRAKVHGTLGFTFNYGHLRTNLNFGYSLGGYAMNTALYSRVENIQLNGILNNQDRRALYDRWQKPGDVASFKAIQRYTKNEPISSRYIQKNNYIEASALQVSWDFANSRLLEQTRLRSLMFTVSTNNLFRLSTIKMERGLQYPYAREITFSLSTSF